MEQQDNTYKTIYFASDLHLGVPDMQSSRERELKFISWLEMAEKDADEIFLLGDIFDMWFEYKHVVPKGFVRLLGKLANLSDKGIKISIFCGNHDMWMFDYFPKEFNISVYRQPKEIEFNGKKFLIGHGDGIGTGDFGYKLVKGIFESKVCRWLFARLHPNFGIGMAHYFSRKSRIANGNYDEYFISEEKEILIQYSKNYLKNSNIDYFVFGHRHLPMKILLSDASYYINTGEWVKNCSYAKLNGTELELLYYKNN